MTPDKRRTTPLVQLLATGWSHAHGGKPLNLVPCRWRMTPSVQVTAVEDLINFVANIHCVPEYSWQCLDFLGTGH